MLTYLVLFTVSAALSFGLAWPVRRMAIALGVVDHPEKRKMHPIAIPLMGGLAIYLSFGIVSLIYLGVMGAVPEAGQAYAGLMAGTAMILAIGLYDDVRGAKPIIKFAGQIVAALMVVAMGGGVTLFTNPLGGSMQVGWLGVPLAVFWIVGVTNAINLIDGLDGLAVGISAIAALGMFAVAAGNSAFVASISIILAGSALGFLRHNFYPARIFLGDTGSLFIGFTLAVTSMYGSYKATTATVLFLPIIVLGVPIFDTLFAIVRRARRRVSPFKADREHIHHRLVRVGLHHRSVVLVIYFVCAYLALTAYSIAQLTYQTAFLFLVLLTMGGMIGLGALQFVERKLTEGSEDRMAQSNAARYSKPRVASGAAHPPGHFSTLVCEVGPFREGFGARQDLQALCSDLSSMLQRRVKVHSVRAEPSAPGEYFLFLRTESLTPAMASVVRDGLAWYLEDQRQRFADSARFPVLRWIPTGASPDSQPLRPEGTETKPRPVPVGGDPARVFGS